LSFFPLIREVINCNTLCEKDTSYGKQRAFQYQCEVVATLHNRTSKNFGEYNDTNISSNIGYEIEVHLDEEGSLPSLLDYRKK
jgi:hypothetical protein